MAKKVLLRYPSERAGKPILASIIRETDATINILHADLTPKGGEILIEIDASGSKINDVVDFFKRRGVNVEEIKRGISLDEDLCLECGACISLCPTDALKLTDDFSIELNEEECVYCEACIPACPTKALDMKKI